jgi:hypothetical protein
MRLWAILMTATTAVLAAAIVFIFLQSSVSSFEIDRDRAALAAEIKDVQAESDKYSGGAIKAFIDLRIAILRNTASMLDQKRASFIHRISLRHTIEGRALVEASDAELKEILDELAQAEKKVTESKLEAARYSGGLIHSMALLRVSTDELSVSQLRMKFYSAKYGIPLPVPDSRASDKPAKVPPGKIVSDREAL